jgi:benzoyl-CoA-dihydrodiol lyase
VPLLAVLPGTGGLTRVTDKRKVRRDRADFFCSTEEGVKGKRAVEWRLVDEILPRSKLDDGLAARVRAFLAGAKQPPDARGIALTPLKRDFTPSGVRYSAVDVDIDRVGRVATITLKGPEAPPPADTAALVAEGAQTWSLRVARELDDAILHLRLNELDIGVLVFKSEGDAAAVLAHDAFLKTNADHWLAREILLNWKRVLKRIDVTSRSLVTLIEPGSCFAGALAELVFAADRSYMLIGQFQGDNRPPATLTLSGLNFGRYPMSNGLTRLETRFLGEPDTLEVAQAAIGRPLDGEEAEALGLVTFARDDIDWEDEVRQFLEGRAAFSPDSLTGMEANLRFGGPETMETKIFARLTAWQNWIFQRPNAVGPDGALRRYGTGQKAAFDMTRV